jgi:hypothetical protein
VWAIGLRDHRSPIFGPGHFQNKLTFERQSIVGEFEGREGVCSLSLTFEQHFIARFESRAGLGVSAELACTFL